ncbi:MAG: EamA family transporter [Eubacteriales bacterium]|nr:EamA family transporter [Eubacteriales bacterium]
MQQQTKRFSLADLLLIFVTIIWGFNVAVVKAALAEFNPLTFNSLRFGISALLSWGMLGLTGARLLPQREDLPRIAFLGLLGHTLYQVLFISGTNLTTAANTALLLATIPVWVAALGAITREEASGPLTWAGIGMSILGIALVTASGDLSLGGSTWLGDIMVVSGTFFYALYTLKSKNLLNKYSPLQFSTWTMTIGALAMILVSLGQIKVQDWSAVGVVGWGGLAFSAGLAITLGYYVWTNGIQKLGSARTAIYNNLTPVTAMIISSLFLKEEIGVLQLAGAALIITGLYITRRTR